MFFDFAQCVGLVIDGGKELPVKSSNNEAICTFPEADELIVFVNSLVEVTEILDGRTTVENSGREDGEKTIDFCRGGRGFKDGGETKEGVCEFPIVFGDKRFDKKLICLLNRRDTVESKFVNEPILEGQVGTFYDTFA